MMSCSDKSATLFLMTSKGYHVLSALTSLGLSDVIDLVVVGQDASIDNDYAEEICCLCKQNRIEWCLKQDKPKARSPFMVAVAWRWMIPVSSPQQLIVVHDSLLPKYRGFAPLVNQLINGEPEIGVTALLGEEDYDVGDILEQRSISISYPITIRDTIDLVVPLYQEIVCGLLKKISAREALQGIPQNHDLATYSLWRDADDYFLDWRDSATKLRRTIDAVGCPYMGAATHLNECVIRVWKAEEVPDVKIENRDCGKVVFVRNGHPVVACGEGLLQINHATFGDGRDVLPLQRFRSRFG